MPGHGPFRGFLAIPYLGADRRATMIRFRCLQDHDHRAFGHGKYMSIADDPPRMYGVDSIHAAGDEIHITEGELDRIVLERIGVHAVAIPGANIWQPKHRIMLSGFSDIFVWADPDDAGAMLLNKITRALPRAKGVRLTEGDVTETWKLGGDQALLNIIEERRGK